MASAWRLSMAISQDHRGRDWPCWEVLKSRAELTCIRADVRHCHNVGHHVNIRKDFVLLVTKIGSAVDCSQR